ncbi:hypothetical protein D3C76_1207080 [compost metagenome]
MPIRTTGSIDFKSAIIFNTRERLAAVLSQEELNHTEVVLDGDQIRFNASDDILRKIEQLFGAPASKE